MGIPENFWMNFRDGVETPEMALYKILTQACLWPKLFLRREKQVA